MVTGAIAGGATSGGGDNSYGSCHRCYEIEKKMTRKEGEEGIKKRKRKLIMYDSLCFWLFS